MLPRIVTSCLIVAVLLMVLLVDLVASDRAAAGSIAPAKTDTSSIAVSIFFTLFTSFHSLYDSARYFNRAMRPQGLNPVIRPLNSRQAL